MIERSTVQAGRRSKAGILTAARFSRSPGGRWLARRRQARLLGTRPAQGRATDHADRHPRLVVAGAATAAGIVFLPLAGLVAAACLATYSAIAASAGLGRRRSQREHRLITVALDALVGLAADLRAGMPPGQAIAVAAPALGLASTLDRGTAPVAVPVAGESTRAVAWSYPATVRRLADRIAAANRVAETTGAPLADLLDRLDTDARAAGRARALAASHAAGISATAWLLAVLPVAGIGVGYTIGVDPLHELLHTRLGAACAVAALLCQLVGLAWTRRLARGGAGTARADHHTDRARWWVRGMIAVAIGLTIGVFVGGHVGLVAAVPMVVLAYLGLGRLQHASDRAARERAGVDLPYAVDLLASVLTAGLPVDRAMTTVAEAVPGPVGDRFARVARSLSLGIDPVLAWAALADLVGGSRLATAAIRSADSGAALAGACGRLAGDLRAGQAVAAETGARRAAVLLVLPLGLCFLPAFVFAGVVPVIVAVLGGVLR